MGKEEEITLKRYSKDHFYVKTKNNIDGFPLKKIYNFILIFYSFLSVSCHSQTFEYSKETEFGIFKYNEDNRNNVEDFTNVMERYLPVISNEVDIKIIPDVTIEIYKDQEGYDLNIMNPDMKGSSAVSGNGKIQIVSPLAKIRIDSLSYEDRLMLLVHEYVHILIDELDNDPAIFIDEGIASFYSSYNFYKSAAIKYVKQINFIPDIKQLKEHYYELPAPDLFSFLFIDFIVQLKGKDMLAKILRESDFLYIEEMNKNWKKFVQKSYYK